MSEVNKKHRAYFHDRMILLLLSINTFLAIALVITSFLSINSSTVGYIKEYRADLGLDGFKAGETQDIVAFGVFAVILFAFQFITSKKLHHIRRHLALITLLLAMIVYIFALLTINALLGLV